MTALGLPYPTIIGTVAGGEWASTVMDRVVAEGRFGVCLGQTPEEDELRAIDVRPMTSSGITPARVEITGARFGSSQVRHHELPVSLANAVRGTRSRVAAPRSLASR